MPTALAGVCSSRQTQTSFPCYIVPSRRNVVAKTTETLPLLRLPTVVYLTQRRDTETFRLKGERRGRRAHRPGLKLASAHGSLAPFASAVLNQPEGLRPSNHPDASLFLEPKVETFIL